MYSKYIIQVSYMVSFIHTCNTYIKTGNNAHICGTIGHALWLVRWRNHASNEQHWTALVIVYNCNVYGVQLLWNVRKVQINEFLSSEFWVLRYDLHFIRALIIDHRTICQNTFWRTKSIFVWKPTNGSISYFQTGCLGVHINSDCNLNHLHEFLHLGGLPKIHSQSFQICLAMCLN